MARAIKDFMGLGPLLTRVRACYCCFVITLRPATHDDARRLFNWRNDPDTCANSINAEPVQWDAHVAWLTKSLASEDRKLLIAEIDGVPVGTVRYDRSGDSWELSWTVAPEHRGRGVGYEIVSAAMRKKPAQIATIKRGNIASQKIAARAGFALAKDGELQTWGRALGSKNGVSPPNTR